MKEQQLAVWRYDHAGALFYLDPPYVGCERDYSDEFAPEDFAQLSDILGQLNGRFILSINDTPLAREVFGRFTIEEVTTTFTASAGPAKRVGELIVTNCT